MNLTKNFERYPLTFGPTPIEKLELHLCPHTQKLSHQLQQVVRQLLE
jgi:1-aminocyclopropane-1-carboxylate deaminase/D-cysteine desulfhydrase-like pyridoxal-dependent ACC family enzyme